MTSRHLPKGTRVRVIEGRNRGQVGTFDGPAKSIVGAARVLLGAQQVPHAIRFDWIECIESVPDSTGGDTAPRPAA